MVPNLNVVYFFTISCTRHNVIYACKEMLQYGYLHPNPSSKHDLLVTCRPAITPSVVFK